MADKTLPDLPFAGALSETDLMWVNQSALDKKDSLDSLAEFFLKTSARGFQSENVAASLDLTAVAITAQFKQYLFDTTAGVLNFTLPFAGGGAPSGACIMAVNASGANTVVVEYQSGITITLPAEGYCFIYFEGTHWELVDNSVSKVLSSFLQIGGATGAKITADATKANLRNAGDSAFLDWYAKNVILSGAVSLETYTKFLTSSVEKAVDFIATDGSLWRMTNVYISGANVKLKTTGTAYRLKIDVTTGESVFDSYTGTADDTITVWTPTFSVTKTGVLNRAGKLANRFYGVIGRPGTDTTHDVTLSVGCLPDSTNVYELPLTAEICKQLDVAWAAGGTVATPAGGLMGGTFTADTEYILFLIYNPTTGVVDAGFSTYTVSGGVAIPDHLPAGFTIYATADWVETDSGSLIIQTTTIDIGGGMINKSYVTRSLDVNLSNTLTSTARQDAIPVPTGFKCRVNLAVDCYDGTSGGVAFIGDPDNTAAFSSLANPIGWVAGNTTSGTRNMQVITNTARQIEAIASVATVDSYNASVIDFDLKRF